MRLALRARALVLASWTIDRAGVERALYPGLEPAAIDGDYMVSIAAVRFAGGRLGPLPVSPFSQLNVRTYVSHEGERAVLFLRSYVTPPGLGAVLVGVPLRAARIRFRPGLVEVPAAGFSLAYRVGEPAEPGELGRHELGLFEAAGLRAVRIRRRPSQWRRADAIGDPAADVLLALGFEPRGEPAVFCTDEASFETDVPPVRIR
jgi:hypothetical protein